MPYKSSEKLNRSAKLRKYASVYKSYIRHLTPPSISKSPRRTREKIGQGTVKKKKHLNEYQKFVKKENKKHEYKDMCGKDRLIIIADKWKKNKEIFKKLI